MAADTNKIIGRKLYTARRRKKLSRAKVAELMGVHETTVKRYEDGDVKALDVEKLKDFSKILNIPLDELIEVVDGSYIFVDDSDNTQNTMLLRLYNEVNFLGNIDLEKRIAELDLKYPNTEDKFQFIVSRNNEIIELQYRAEIVNPYFLIVRDIVLAGVYIHDDSINKIALPGMYAVVEICGNIGDEDILENGNLIMTIDKNNEVIFRHYSKHGDTIVLTPNSNNKTIQPIVFFEEEIKQFRLLGRVWGFVTTLEEYVSKSK